jgi:hypothetical protein
LAPDVDDQVHASAALSPVRTLVFIEQEDWSASKPVWTAAEETVLSLPGFEPQIMQPVVQSLYQIRHLGSK